MPRWSPDGKQIVFVRTPGQEAKLPLIPVRPQPWSLWIADEVSGTAHQLWHSGDKLDDSLPGLTEDTSLNFADGRIVFSSEQDGRNHLYSIPPSGGTPTLLTAGDFDVEDVTLTPDKKSVIFSSNQDDVDRRHLWRVSVSGGSPQEALTKGETMEWSPVVTADGKNILCLGSTATVPAMPYQLTANGRDMIAKQALGEFPSSSLVTPKQVIFKSEDGLTVHGQLFLPRNASGKVPGLVFMHGGPIRQMMLGFHYMDYYHNAYAMNEYLASRGYAVLSVNYRLGVMYGRAFREPPNTVWRGAAEYKDVVAAARYLQSLPEVDADKIGLWGGSYGGFLTAMGLAKNSDLFKTGVDFHGVHDWSVFLTERPYFGSVATKPPDEDVAVKLAWESSPDAYVSTWKYPVLLIHGGGLVRDPGHLGGEAVGREGGGVRQSAGERDHLRPRGDRHQVTHRRGAHHLRATGEQVRVALEVAGSRMRAAPPRWTARATRWVLSVAGVRHRPTVWRKERKPGHVASRRDHAPRNLRCLPPRPRPTTQAHGAGDRRRDQEASRRRMAARHRRHLQGG